MDRKFSSRDAILKIIWNKTLGFGGQAIRGVTPLEIQKELESGFDIHITPRDILIHLSKLEKEGAIRREEHPADKRKTLYLWNETRSEEIVKLSPTDELRLKSSGIVVYIDYSPAVSIKSNENGWLNIPFPLGTGTTLNITPDSETILAGI